MGIVLLILGVVIVLGIAIALAFSAGLFRIQRVDIDSGRQADQTEPESAGNDPYSPFPGEDQTDHAEPPAPVDPEEEAALRHYDYFVDEPAEAPVQTPAEKPEHECDKLCGLPTGRSFLVDAQKVLNQASSEKRGYALLYFDFDRFRFFNSLKGQSIGDHVLSRMAQELEEMFTAEARITRISADHFAVLFPMADEAMLADYTGKIKQAADRIRETMGAKSGLRVSVGAAIATQPADYNICTLTQAANIARFCAKSAKNAEYSLYDGTMTETYLYGESAMEDFNDNQYDEEIAIYYQPLFDIVRNRVTGFEALVRWRCELESHRQVALTPDNGRLPVNNLKVIYHVCRVLSRWRKNGTQIPDACVSLAATDLYREDIDEFIAQCLMLFQIEPYNLIIGVDVSAVRLDWSAACRQLKKLKEIGARIAVYGFDRAYTSFELLDGMPVDFVKLHHSFASGMDSSQEAVEAVRKILSAAQSHNYTAVIEGVKSKKQIKLLRSMGAQMVQGSLSGYAMEADEFLHAYLEQHVDLSAGADSGTTILDDSQLAKGDFHVY